MNSVYEDWIYSLCGRFARVLLEDGLIWPNLEYNEDGTDELISRIAKH